VNSTPLPILTFTVKLGTTSSDTEKLYMLLIKYNSSSQLYFQLLNIHILKNFPLNKDIKYFFSIYGQYLIVIFKNASNIPVTQTCLQINEKLSYHEDEINLRCRFVLTYGCGMRWKWYVRACSEL